MPTTNALSPSLVLTLAFATALALQLLVQLWLNTRQVRHVAQHRDQVPGTFANHISLAAHQKAADYTLAKARLGLAHMAWGALILLGWTLLGGSTPCTRRYCNSWRQGWRSNWCCWQRLR